MSKFTPGPWEAKNIFENWVITDSHDLIIDIRGSQANAKLVAAAPEMYEALLELSKYLDFDQRVSDDEEFCFSDASGIDEAFQKASIALDKARQGLKEVQA